MTCAVAELLATCVRLGVTITPIGISQLKFRGPKPVPVELVERLRAHKAELLAVTKISQAQIDARLTQEFEGRRMDEPGIHDEIEQAIAEELSDFEFANEVPLQ